MELEKKVIASIHYREIPMCLETLLNSDKDFSFIKDGNKKIDGYLCPRITVRYQPKNTQEDKKLLNKLEKLLIELEANNQIVSFSIYT